VLEIEKSLDKPEENDEEFMNVDTEKPETPKSSKSVKAPKKSVAPKQNERGRKEDGSAEPMSTRKKDRSVSNDEFSKYSTMLEQKKTKPKKDIA